VGEERTWVSEFDFVFEDEEIRQDYRQSTAKGIDRRIDALHVDEIDTVGRIRARRP
jgi:hypothetical protein